MITLPTAADAHAWGTQLAPTLAAGDVIALCGNLGAGKTQITRGIVAGMNSAAEVTSPTFTLVHEYLDGKLVPPGEGRPPDFESTGWNHFALSADS